MVIKRCNKCGRITRKPPWNICHVCKGRKGTSYITSRRLLRVNHSRLDSSDYYNEIINSLDQNMLLEIAEESLPPLIASTIRNIYPADPLTRYIIGEISLETSLFIIVVIRSRIDNSELSLLQLSRQHAENRIYERTRRFSFAQQIAQEIWEIEPKIILDYR